ncbi:MAG TPA: hypothetical protein VIS10_06970 [Anaerolineales bacterium]
MPDIQQGNLQDEVDISKTSPAPKAQPQLDETANCYPQTPVSKHDLSLPDLDFEPDPRLVAEGWERRFMADADRAKEAVELYQSLGFEVLTEEVKPTELSDLCLDCQLVVCRYYVTVYTRKK